MLTAQDAREMEESIQLEYQARLTRDPEADKLGWRLLYSPKRALTEASVAFIGLNPGGSFINPRHGVFSTERGSAYCREVEDWGASQRLQDQVVALFKLIDVQPEDVLAGNLVPFRSRSESSLRDARGAISFGKSLWKQILQNTQPSLVISMGSTANSAISQILDVQNVKSHLVGWGDYTGSRGQFLGGTWIGLPHLSRFTIMTRDASKAAVNELLKGLNGR